MGSVRGSQAAGASGGKIRVLIVCMWPLGGIRTYLKYNYRYLPMEQFEVTLLANPVIEREAVQQDMAELGIRVIWAPPVLKRDMLFWHVLKLRMRETFDVIHSQGFISAFSVALVNRVLHTPHAMTMHGVLEEKRFAGRLGGLKRRIFERVMGDVDVFVGVGRDILGHVQEGLAALREKSRWVVIRNGIDPAPFVQDYPEARAKVRRALGVDGTTFVFGYFGRFMPEKGFPYLIDAVACLRAGQPERKFVVLAVGSGDYERQYREKVRELGLEEFFRFQPFQPNVAELMQGCDAVVMPSVWEAYPLLTSEVMCCGVPIVATDCPGLREAVEETPSVVVPLKDAAALAGGMKRVMGDEKIRAAAQAFRAEAATRYDVRRAADELQRLLREMAGR